MNTQPERRWRTAQPRLGVAWVNDRDVGIPVGWRVKVTATYDNKNTVHAEGTGIDRQVFASRLDFGIELLTARGQWIPDSDFRARRWLWKVMRGMHKGIAHPGAEGLSLDRIHQILARHQR